MSAGFAIFFQADRVPTWGCISLQESDVLRYQRGAVPGDRIVMGVDDDIFSQEITCNAPRTVPRRRFDDGGLYCPFECE
ncbi:hypothetical protein [Arthrobacter sp. ISL-30]|uniref:hypothetical protein n=1 Tax=Arthrobacter sp. ISL-30 TaxID=2819109 RepID=UPI001BE61C41|nr:hypothetical protein [Arthrobacter sp. ISL-30]MBT2512015.1 hypothetical protein [Arthrobacter sp. ISL-30]